jgi:hypothetical protein
MRGTILRWGSAAILLAIVGSCAAAVDLAKEDIDFRKQVYVNTKGDKLPYRLLVPFGDRSANTYSLELWLHRGEGRGNDNVERITHGNEKGTHVWISSEVQSEVFRICTGASVPRGRELVRPETESANQRAATAAGTSGQRRKTVRG